MSGDSARAAGLSPSKRALLERLLQGKRPAAAAPAIPRHDPAAGSPLSFAQQRLWFIHQIDPSSPAYNVPNALRLRGSLDPAVLERCIAEVARRHASLRTRFEVVGGAPIQVVEPEPRVELSLVDLSHLPAAAREEEARRLAGAEASAPFDLARGPLLRTRLLRLAGDDHVFLLTMHHIVSDGWSMGVLVQEVTALYQAFAAGRPSPLPDLPIQYADFAAWQREALSGARLESELAYWRERLTPLPPPLDLPADRPRPPVQTFRGGVERVAIPAGIADAMRALARGEGATLFMALLAAFAALLARLTGQKDVTVGTGIANRTLPELESLIGFFVNALVVRTSCQGDPPFRQLLGRVREAALGAFAHQDLPFERLVEELQPPRDLSRNPIFQVAFALQNAPRGDFELPGLTIGPVPSETGATRFDLEFHLWEESGGGLDGYLFYSADMFDAPTVRRIAGRYQALLASVAEDPDLPLSRLRAAAGDELERATQGLARGRDLPFPPRPAYELFEERAARAPHLLAVEEAGRRITYGRLDAAADRLAARLIGLGAGREARVAILAGRSIEQVTAILAVAKSGAAYLPLDPANPDARLATMLEAAGAHLVLAPRALASRRGLAGRRVVDLDDAPAGDDPPRAARAASPADLAYVIFTSGSTGDPSGVEVTHANLANLVAWHRAAFGLTEADRATLISGVGFDASVWELWPALASGASLLIPDDATRLHPPALRDWLVERGATVAFLPTPLAELLLALEWPRACALRTMLTGGDRLHAVDPARVPFRVVNNYGPTETTVVATSGEADTGGWLGMPTIGGPVANARAFVLDAGLRPVPIGVPGELCIGGAGVARGYAGRPDRTAERFLPDPYSRAPGVRLYRTGDRARQLADGRIEFLGRLDTQVKVRGHRVEPAEVESALAAHPGVEAVAVVADEESGGTRLVAYVAPRRAGGEGGRWEAEHLARWRDLYDETYARSPERRDPSFDITGWNSSYTGAPIDAAEMREWRDRTVERILERPPRRVLEIGCGTGLLLTRIAPRCEGYVATDFSAVSLGLVRRAVAGREDCACLELLQRDADDFSGLEAGSFDMIILNSVVQYFPGADYLERVLRGSMRLLGDGGRLFVGDVRDARLHQAFAASVARHGAGQASPGDVRARAGRLLANEEELLVSPHFFAGLAAGEPRGAWVEVLVKRGRADNELTRFRYDAVLHVGSPPPAPAEREIPWEASAPSRLGKLFLEGVDRVLLRGVPNARIAGDVAAARALAGPEPELREAPAAAHPDDVAALGGAQGYTGIARLSPDGEELFDVAFTRRATGSPAETPAFPALPGDGPHRLTNAPVRATIAGTLAPALRELAAARLPEFMVPSAFVVLDELPLTASGKIDRRALPAGAALPAAAGARVPPRTAMERAVAGAWCDVLRVERVGATDNFFDLGGHSLLATQVISRLRSALGVEVPLRVIFESPTVEKLGRWIESARAPAEAGGPIRHLDRAGPMPLSFAQQRLWFIDRLEPGIAAYNIPNAIRLQGDLDVPALSRAMGEIVRRHESLRTRFVEGPEGPGQVIDATLPPPWVVEALEASPDPEARARRIVTEEAMRPFDLARGPLLRGRLLRLGPRDHVLSLVVHHIVADGWSMGLLVRELGKLYEAYSRAADSPLAELPIQYADWASWQRAWLEEGEHERQLAYWRRELADVPPLLLPTDRSRPSHPSYSGAALDVILAAPLVERLGSLARSEGATLHMVLLAAFAATLSRWSGQDDITVGTPVAGRTRQEVEPLIGFFVNTLAIRTRLAGRNLTYRQLVGRIRETALGALAHQEVPFERVVEAVRPERDTSRNPIFQALFALHNMPLGHLALPGLTVGSFDFAAGTAQFDVEMSLFEVEGTLAGRLQWSTDLFEPETMQRFAEHFRRFVELAAGDPDLVLRKAPILSEAERALLVGRPEPGLGLGEIEPTLVGVFEAQVDARGAAPALRVGGREISYALLDSAANRLARRLMRCGVGRGARVGVFLERGADLITAVLAILKAGAAYVPLDPAYPARRLLLMAEEACLRAVVTTTSLAGRLPPGAEETVCLDRDPEPPPLDDSRPGIETAAEDLVYVIFTSGSTGRPKGAALHQGVLLNLIAWQRARSAAPPLRRTLQYSSMSFDVSFLEIFATFAEGGTLVLVSEEERRDPAALLEVVAREGIERLFLPLVALQSLSEAAEELAPSLSLREVVTAGEQLRVTVPIRRFFQGLPGATLDNQYGPSETHVVTAERLEGDPLLWPELPCIGRAVPHTRVVVLDEGLEPSPLGVAGEIYLGGEAPGRGYLNRPDLTAERFLPDPFAHGGRLYRTGDLGRRLPDGRLEFLGRSDRQIKIRGYRVEPAEVEAALARCGGVRAVAVEARAPLGAGPRLVAYVVPEEGLRGRVATLRDALAQELPDYLVPSRFVELDALPLTPSGKVDRRALPDPGPEAAQAGACLSPLEAIVAGVFEETLGVRCLGADAHFFDLGGHSLLATRVVARLRRVAGVDLPLRTLFDAPRVRDLSGALAAALRQGGTPAGRIPRVERLDRAPVSFQQERMWFLERFEPGGSTFTLTAALRLRGALDVNALRGALDELVRRHASLRTRFDEEDGAPVQIIDAPRPVRLDPADLSGAADAEQELRRRLEAEAAGGFDLALGPLWRPSLLRVGPDDHALILAMHHIVTDGWSAGVLVRELGVLYESGLAGRASALAPLPIQYADYAAWQRAWLQGDELERQVEYWRRSLEGVEPLELPADRPRPPVQGHDGARVQGRVDGELADRLRALAREEGATLHMVLLAAYGLVLSRWSGQEDFAVGTPVANRTQEEAEGLIGFFVNTLVLRLNTGGEGTTFRDLIARVRESALGAYAHQEMPFESLLEALDPPRDLSRTPVFQVWFNFVNVPEEEPRLGDLKVEPLGADAADAKFDLSLYARESGEAIDLDAVYSAPLFDAWRIQEFLDQLVLALEQASRAPERSLQAISLVTPGARATLPDPVAPLSEAWHGAVHERFARRAKAHPSAPAVADPGDAATYGHLEARTNQLARWLAEQGAGPGETVALYAHRSASTLWGMLGVLKTGAALTMLDPSHPTPRLLACLQEARPRAVVEIEAAGGLPRELSDFLREELGAGRIALPRLGAPAGADPFQGVAAAPLDLPVGPDDLACIVFTSGSTGTPKGVRGRHGSLSHFQPFLERRFHIGPGDRFSMLSGLSHDPIQRDVFTALMAGACVCVPDPAEIDPSRLASWAARARVTVMNLTPAMAKVLTGGPHDRGFLPELRVVFLVGEQLTRHDVERLRNLAPSATVVNLYGTTETQRAIGFFVIPPGEPLRGEDGAPIRRAMIPAGVGMEDAQLLVRRDGGREAGVGELGEIWIRSPHLALGYLDEALTRERFVGDGPDRSYRTGDWGRYLPGGVVTVAGRRDGQANIRGYRVELGEVEAALAAQLGVRDAAARLDGEGRLIAYVTPQRGLFLDPAAVRQGSRTRLPEYMVPAAVVVLPELPLTPNGKLDRRALPAPAWGTGAARATPRTPDEEMACALFAQVLGIAQASPDDSFFDLGGHSLLATRLVSRVRSAMGAEVSLRSLFESPTPAGLARLVAAARRQGAAPARRVERASELERRKLSFAQSRLWFLDRLEPESAAYNVATALRLSGDLDPGALGRALAEIERRHETLRTRFVPGPDGAEQDFSAPRGRVLECEDLTVSEDGWRDLQRRIDEEASAPFDLQRGPLWRVRLLRLSPSEHVMSLVFHHAVTDGWSMDLFVRELAVLYDAFAAGRESPLTDLPIQYADWAAWQRGWLEGGELDRQLAYWRRELEGIEPLQIPTDAPRPARRSLHGASVGFELDEEDAASLMRFARAEGATLFHVLLACFAALLARYAGNEDVVVGTPVANRTLEEVEPLLGFFANTLPVRIRVEPGLGLAGLVRRVRERTLDAYAHQDVPFEAIVEALNLKRDLSRNPLFDAMFVLQHPGSPEGMAGGLTVETLPADTGATPFDLTLVMAESGGKIFGSLLYDADLFHEATARRFLAYFAGLAATLARHPDARLEELDLRTPGERALVESTNSTAVARPERLMHELARDRQDWIGSDLAVVGEDQELTYAELEELSNRIARRLRRAGVAPEVGVGLLAGRTAASIAGLLGISKSGGVLVPLDASLPAPRLAVMLAAAGVGAVVTERGLHQSLPATDLRIVQLDAEGLSSESPDPLEPLARPANAAYVIFTSGSTGEPKGVVVEHRAIAERMLTWIEQQRLRPGDRALHFLSRSFDAGLQEILVPLAAGATLVVHPDPRGETPQGFLRRVERVGCTVVSLPVGFLNELANDVARSGGALPESLRLVVTGGESPSGSRIASLIEASRGRLEVTNAYGPTEAVVDATAHQITTDAPALDPLPIGLPLTNTTAHLLDATSRPVPLGAVGEIFLGGSTLARGYAGKAPETAAAFIPDPFSAQPGARLYRTGDLARRLENGELLFLGRRDSQVKLRGFRIELAEIEAALVHLREVREAVVTLRDDGAGDYLAAYFVPAQGADAQPERIRDALRATLPDYMVPAAFVTLDRMPLTGTGKVDRRALAAPGRGGSRRAAVAPRDELERQVAQVWAEALGGGGSDVEENFFEAGGNSLLAVRIVAAIRRRLGVEIPVAAVFREPTIAGLARLLGGATPAASPLVLLRPGQGLPPLVCVHEIGGGVSAFSALASHLDPRRPVLGIQALLSAPEGGVEGAAAEYAAAIAREVPEGPVDLLGWSYGGLVAYATALRLREAGREVRTLVLLDAPAPEGKPEGGPALARAASMLWGVEVGDGDADQALAAARAAEAIPSGLEGKEARAWLAGVAARMEAAEAYRPRPYDGDVVLVRGTESVAGRSRDEAFGWPRFVTGNLTVEWAPGSHYSVVRGEGARAVAAIVERHAARPAAATRS
jgi:amino acid adenylation domain-containing protein